MAVFLLFPSLAFAGGLVIYFVELLFANFA